LILLIDYLGFRLTAIPLLPVHARSLLYGSSDAGKRIYWCVGWEEMGLYMKDRVTFSGVFEGGRNIQCVVCVRERQRQRDGEMPERRKEINVLRCDRISVRIDLRASYTSQIRLFKYVCSRVPIFRSAFFLPSPSLLIYPPYPSSFLLSRSAGVHEKLRGVGTRLGLKEHWAGRGDKGDKGGASLLAIQGHGHRSSTRASAGRGRGGAFAASVPLPEQPLTDVHGSSARDSDRGRDRDEVVVRSSAPLFTPVDLEVHRGLDGHLYALDFARLFPPEVRVRGTAIYTTEMLLQCTPRLSLLSSAID
jgi:hypothetical protein